MTTWLDQQIEELENNVEKKVDSRQAVCAINCGALPQSYEDTGPHISLAAFLDMQVRYGARIFAGRAARDPDPDQTTNS